LHYRDLLAADGKLKAPAEIEGLLAARGIVKKTPIVSYCTGGIRSGWMTMVLQSLGYDASNYAGSMWQWSSLPPEQFPLRTD
jgi:thiosulfate/3-mercaptopyruvate sulfurtransferase